MAGDTCLTAKPEDRRIVRELLQCLRSPENTARPVGELAVMVGRFFLGSPYASGTIERQGAEKLVVNLRQFDCFTFVENAVVLARLLRNGEEDFSRYTAALTRTRYRGGRLNGYASRLHYFSDWLRDNQRKGILKDVTREIGGSPRHRAINFMTANSARYPALKSPDVCREMLAVEKRCSRRRLFHIPKRELNDWEDTMLDGDLIGITTEREGLDVSHAGLAVRIRGKIHLLHASPVGEQVILSRETLYRYLAADTFRAGIMIGRLR